MREYLVWRVEDAAIDWFVLRGGRYGRPEVDAERRLKGEIFPGLWLAPTALLRGDIHRGLQVLQRGLTTESHAAFALRPAGRPTSPATER